MNVGTFACSHQVAIASDGVDLTVVGHHPERLSEVPEWEGVGRVSLVKDGECGLVHLILEVLEIRPHLGRVEHPLVDNRTIGE